jgi:DNA-binding response OmpR family regulator
MNRRQESHASRPRVLVVDDDPAIRLLLSKFLEQCGYRVETAESGEAALELFNAATFGVLMVDLQLQGITGLEVASVIRSQRVNIPIALITGITHTLGEYDLEKAGITKLFTKPFDLDMVAAWLQSVLLP